LNHRHVLKGITACTNLGHTGASIPTVRAGEGLRLPPYKRYVEIGEGTHTIITEKNRMQFFHEIMNFLKEPDAQSLN
jgi:hypothetical protein